MSLPKLLNAIALVLILTIPPACLAETAVFQEGISDADGENSTYNMEVGMITSGFGGPLTANDANHQIGGLNTNWGRVLLRWDISSLAGKGTITGARAKITFEPVVRAEGFATVPDPFSYRWHRISDANKDWIDAQVSRDRPRTGETWAGSAGLGTAGVDYIETPVSTLTFDGGLNDTSKKVLTFEFDDITFFQDWVNNPSNNAGFLLKSEELEVAGSGDFQFAQGTMFPDDVTDAPSRYPLAVPEDRPILEIDFTPGAGVAGDYNGNGTVDAADYVLWRDTLESTTVLRADGDGDLVIGPGDHTFWKARFGNVQGLGAVSVPEPSALALSLFAVGMSLFARQCSRRSVAQAILRDADRARGLVLVY